MAEARRTTCAVNEQLTNVSKSLAALVGRHGSANRAWREVRGDVRRVSVQTAVEFRVWGSESRWWSAVNTDVMSAKPGPDGEPWGPKTVPQATERFEYGGDRFAHRGGDHRGGGRGGQRRPQAARGGGGSGGGRGWSRYCCCSGWIRVSVTCSPCPCCRDC